jgi:hypothetical protein
LKLRRQFELRERLSLQARADFFNIFNHPNFGRPIKLNPLYQIGGPRSAQLALKLIFLAIHPRLDGQG